MAIVIDEKKEALKVKYSVDSVYAAKWDLVGVENNVCTFRRKFKMFIVDENVNYKYESEIIKEINENPANFVAKLEPANEEYAEKISFSYFRDSKYPCKNFLDVENFSAKLGESKAGKRMWTCEFDFKLTKKLSKELLETIEPDGAGYCYVVKTGQNKFAIVGVSKYEPKESAGVAIVDEDEEL